MKAKTVEILLVEDSVSDAQLVIAELQSVLEYNFVVEHVESLQEALDALKKRKFDAAIIDLSLPDSTGLSSYIKLRQQALQLPIIVFTGHEDSTIPNQALNAGADNYLIKGKMEGNRIATAVLASIIRRTQELNPKDIWLGML
jgi:DNA-binding NarL/FixJ family response regulator